MKESFRNMFVTSTIILVICTVICILLNLNKIRSNCLDLPTNFIVNNIRVTASGGRIIKKWEGQIQFIQEECSMKTSFLYEGKQVVIIGGLVIIEEQ